MSNLPIKQLVHDVLFQLEDSEPSELISCLNCRQAITANNYRTRITTNTTTVSSIPMALFTMYAVSILHPAPSSMVEPPRNTAGFKAIAGNMPTANTAQNNSAGIMKTIASTPSLR